MWHLVSGNRRLFGSSHMRPYAPLARLQVEVELVIDC
jgi:hypothetical protein